MNFTTPRSVVEHWQNKTGNSAEELEIWINYCKDNLGFGGLSIAEESVLIGVDDLTNQINKLLSTTESAVLEFIKAKVSGDLDEMKKNLEISAELSRSKKTRDLVLEGRIRMELGLIQFQEGDIESARDSVTWAETRLKSVARYTLQHDISLLNKAAFHYAIGEDLMALNFYSEISLEKEHANETKGISRVSAGSILRDRGHTAAAARHYWNAFHYFSKTPLHEMRLEAGMLFLQLGGTHFDPGSKNMTEQIVDAKPMAAGDEIPQARINGDDLNTVINACAALIEENNIQGNLANNFSQLREIVMGA